MANNQMENVSLLSKDRAVKEVSRIYFADSFIFDSASRYHSILRRT